MRTAPTAREAARTHAGAPRSSARVQGYLSWWNDNISYVLRGCILIELSLRGRIDFTKDTRRRALSDRMIEVVDKTVRHLGPLAARWLRASNGAYRFLAAAACDASRNGVGGPRWWVAAFGGGGGGGGCAS